MPGKYNRKDSYYRQAKQEGYKSRAAFKLIELDKRFKLLQRNFKVLDLGAWPGGWLQVAAKKVGPYGLAVGIDLVEIEDFEQNNVQTITGDARDEEVLEKARSLARGSYDLVVCDMSPKLTGIKDVDRTAAIACAELAFWISERMLKVGGNLVIKVFKGNETEVFVKDVRPMFNKLVRVQPKSSRRTSNEFYVVGLGLKNSVELNAPEMDSRESA